MRCDRYRGLCLSCPRPRDPKLPLEKGRPMLGSILIVDGNAYNGFGLSLAIEENDGCVAGPVATAADARIILDSRPIAGAIVDCDDDGSEAADVVMLLAGKGIPTVVQTVWPTPSALQALNGRATVLAH